MNILFLIKKIKNIGDKHKTYKFMLYKLFINHYTVKIISHMNKSSQLLKEFKAITIKLFNKYYKIIQMWI